MEQQAAKMRMFLLCFSLLCSLAQLDDVSQPISFQAVKLGDTVSVTCRVNRAARTIVWYKLTTARRLRLLASVDVLYNITTYNEQPHRVSVKSESSSSRLTVARTTWEDAGMYYCGVLNLENVQFGPGTFLMIKGMISDSVVQQPESESVQSGDSVTLSCSVPSGHCSAEHTEVMWLKNSHKSAPEMIYSSEDQNISCQRTESGETTCVYNLLMRNLSSDDAGTFYCVVTSCGRILLGNGTTIQIHSDASFTRSVDLSPALIALMMSNIILGLVTILLVWTLCKIKKDPKTSSGSSCESADGNQPGDAVMYAAVCLPSRNSSCRSAPVKHSRDAVVYSAVNFSQRD